MKNIQVRDENTRQRTIQWSISVQVFCTFLSAQERFLYIKSNDSDRNRVNTESKKKRKNTQNDKPIHSSFYGESKKKKKIEILSFHNIVL